MNHQKELYELALFAGIGGGILGSGLLGFRTVCGVEKEEYPQRVLMERQNDGTFPPFPIWDDVCTFDPGPWKGHIDLISGGFPCQDISIAGKGIGLNGERSGLWREMARIIDGIHPPFVFIENSPELAKKGLEYVLYDLARMGYNAAWGIYSAADTGAPHIRRRLWILALLDTYGNGWQAGDVQLAQPRQAVRTAPAGQSCGTGGLSCLPARRESEQEDHGRREGGTAGAVEGCRADCPPPRNWWSTEPAVPRVVDGIPDRVDRIKALGNAQVPGVAARAFCDLFKQLTNTDFLTWQNQR